MIHRYLLFVLILAPAPVVAGEPLSLQEEEHRLDCNQRWTSRRNASHCEMRETSLPPTAGVLSVDGGTNGSIYVKGWSRIGILVRAKVQAFAETESEAQEIVRNVQIDTDRGTIQSKGPRVHEGSWSVSYEFFVPHRSDLSLKTHNGGIGITDVEGQMELNALNGGISLRRLSGSVRGATTNGGLTVDLDGHRWSGEGLDVKTTNGGVTIRIPWDYSAVLETGTVNGKLRFDFPVTVQGRIDRQLSITLGNGGPAIRARTTNGGVTVARKS